MLSASSRRGPVEGERGVAPLDEPVALACEAMGTRFELLAAGVAPGVSRTDARAACEQAVERIGEWHERLTIFDPGSEVSRLNARAGRGPVPVSDDLFDLLETCARLRRATRGAFDGACGGLMRRYGFRHPPGAGALEPGSSHAWGWRWIGLDPIARTVELARPGLELDLGGIAKGFALDQAGRVLREAGVGSALIHGGTSSVLTIGGRPDGPAWRVALGPDDGDPVAELVDAAMAVSAPHGRTVEDGRGGRIGHVLDPRTGLPVGSARCAGVVAPSGVEADAWSTALLVLGTRPPTASSAMVSAIRRPAGWRLEGRGGAIRACGQAGDENERGCEHDG